MIDYFRLAAQLTRDHAAARRIPLEADTVEAVDDLVYACPYCNAEFLDSTCNSWPYCSMDCATMAAHEDDWEDL